MQNVKDFINECENDLQQRFKEIDEISLLNQEKVLNAFKNNNVSARHFNFSTGYGYDDIGKNTLCKVYSDIFHSEDAIVSPHIASGTHALTIALFGLLKTGDEIIFISGNPYDTLDTVINGIDNGSLRDYGINNCVIQLKNNDFDYDLIEKSINDKTKVIFIGRSRGYEWRDAISLIKMQKAIKFVKAIKKDMIIMVDNCYGEFVNTIEPTDIGADIVVGSLIKNIGGGLAVSGGYIAGKKDCITKISYRLTSPSIGNEVGSYYGGYLSLYQGLFLAPHITANAVKGSILMSKVFEKLGYDVLPKYNDEKSDIITSIKFNDKDKLIKFCQIIQNNSPVDSNVTPYPWDMPGYSEQVIMAAGTFVQGASIELSCDSPIKPPYIVYIQGGLTYEHIKIALINVLKELN